MAKIDLKKSSGYEIVLENGSIQTTDLKYVQVTSYNIDDVRGQLLNEDLSYPEHFYDKYVGLDHDEILAEKSIKVNAFVIPSNLAGIEYVKTRAIRMQTYPKVLEVWYGGGTLILQRLVDPESPRVYLVKLKRNDKMIVPPGYSTVLVNTRQSHLVVGEVYNSSGRQFALLDEMKGMAYYVIRKNAKQEVVRNPSYKTVPKYRKLKWEDVVEKHNITLKTPIIKQILRKYEKFDWLFKENSLDF